MMESLSFSTAQQICHRKSHRRRLTASSTVCVVWRSPSREGRGESRRFGDGNGDDGDDGLSAVFLRKAESDGRTSEDFGRGRALMGGTDARARALSPSFLDALPSQLAAAAKETENPFHLRNACRTEDAFRPPVVSPTRKRRPHTRAVVHLRTEAVEDVAEEGTD